MTRSRTIVVAALVLLAGCSAFRDHRRGVADAYASGEFEAAAASLDARRELYGSTSDLLWKLDRGSVALATGDHETCLRVLEEAERDIEAAGGVGGGGTSASDDVARWAVNDAAATYVAQPYEDMYVNVMKLLAQLEAGRIGGGATVEARRLASKSTRLRDRYLSYRERASGEVDAEILERSSNLVSANEEGQFIESPLGTYLSCVSFLADGEFEMAEVAARRLMDSLRLQQGLVGEVRPEGFDGLARSVVDGRLLLVALSGRGPTRTARSFGPIVIGRVPIYFELPYVERHASRVSGVEAEFDDGRTVSLALVEDLGAVAAENHRRALPAIYARTFARAAAKAGISFAVTEGVRDAASDQDKGWATAVSVIAGLAAIMATERADTRAWATLPGRAYVGLADATGARVRLVYRGAGGAPVRTTEWMDVEGSGGGGMDSSLRTIVSHDWN